MIFLMALNWRRGKRRPEDKPPTYYVEQPEIDPLKPDELVTVARFCSSLEAELGKSTLENEGIEAAIMGAIISSIHGSSTRMGIALNVRSEDTERALAILRDIR